MRYERLPPYADAMPCRYDMLRHAAAATRAEPPPPRRSCQFFCRFAAFAAEITRHFEMIFRAAFSFFDATLLRCRFFMMLISRFRRYATPLRHVMLMMLPLPLMFAAIFVIALMLYYDSFRYAAATPPPATPLD